MKPSFVSLSADPHGRRSCFCSLLPIASVLFLVIIIGSVFIAPGYTEKFSRWRVVVQDWDPKFNKCENQCRPYGSEALPKGIVSNTSDLEMRPLWMPRENLKKFYGEREQKNSNLFSVAAGIKQKDLVNEMVRKFLSSGFVVMLFHYDGIVDGWKEFEWDDLVIHVSAVNQTKWWFAKRFLHPDIIAEYNYIFLWDEDLGVENFDPERYLSIVKSEGLEISQPALDRDKSEVHHQITARGRRSIVHRRTYKPGGPGVGCDSSSTAPPCTGWIEMMAPVFSRASWRCVWYMIQNDLVHAWGLDVQLGYCAQGDRTKNVGVVDAEFIVHYGLPTLGGVSENKTISLAQSQTSETENITSTISLAPSTSDANDHRVDTISPAPSETFEIENMTNTKALAPPASHANDHRVDVRRQSYFELAIFNKRWKKAAEDECWIDPYQQPAAIESTN